MSQLIFWNKSEYATLLSQSFLENDIITDSFDCKDILKRWENYSSIIILCELDWDIDGKAVRMQHFSGVELAKRIRTAYDIDLPILFVSFYPLKKIFNAETEILTAIGHSFLRLPTPPEAFANKLIGKKRLSRVELRDIQLFSCAPRGIIMHKLHQIQGVECQIDQGDPDRIMQKFEQCIEDIHAVVKVSPLDAISKFKQKFPKVDNKNITSAVRYIDTIGKNLIEKYISADTNLEILVSDKKPWSLLLLDDELNEDSKLVKLIQDRGVNVILTSNAHQADSALQNDDRLRNEITLVLCDFRLNEFIDGIMVQQPIQGYTFLQDVGEKFQGRLLSALIYSGMPRQFLLESFKTFKIRTEVYSKIDFKVDDPVANNFLVNRIIEIGDENYKALQSLPLSSKGWANSKLHETYLLYRRQLDYEKRERDICEYCTNWVNDFRKGKMPATPMIKGDKFRVLKNKKESETLIRFEAYYKTRRLAQFLYLYFESRRDKVGLGNIPSILTPKGKNMSSAIAKRGFYSQIIGFKKEEFPLSSTIEELNWFEYDLGIPVLEDYKLFRNALNVCEEIIGEFISEINILKDSLNDIGYKYVDVRGDELNFDQYNHIPYLFDRSDISLCLQWLGQQKESFNQEALEEYIDRLKKIKSLIGGIWNELAFRNSSKEDIVDYVRA